eukprot:scaffold154672_cov38-Attheya_sp.AAC.4
MGSIDAACSSCGSNPGIFVAIRDLFPELSPLLCRVGVELRWIEMGSIDAACSSCGSNPDIFVAIRDLFPELSPRFHVESRSGGGGAIGTRQREQW